MISGKQSKQRFDVDCHVKIKPPHACFALRTGKPLKPRVRESSAERDSIRQPSARGLWVSFSELMTSALWSQWSLLMLPSLSLPPKSSDLSQGRPEQIVVDVIGKIRGSLSTLCVPPLRLPWASAQ